MSAPVRSSWVVRGLAIFSLVVVAACASRPYSGGMQVSLEPAQGTTETDMLIATTRARAEEPDTLFGTQRQERLDFAEVTVSIPPTHTPGNIEWPSSPPGDPNTDFVVRSAAFIDGETAFRSELSSRLRAKPKGSRTALVFIHGYNTLFAEAVFRFAQFTADSKFDGVPVLFTWASEGDVTGYVYDTNSATIARNGLQQTLLDVAATKPDEIIIMAHSLGNWALLETLRQMELSGNSIVDRSNVTVVMAAPDVDLDVFQHHMELLRKPNNPFVVLTSQDDRALGVSGTLAGGRGRVGSFSDTQELSELGVIVLDLTDLEGNDAANHNKFALLANQIPQVASAVSQQIDGDIARERGFSRSVGDAGRDLGSFIGNAASVVITVPASIARAGRTTSVVPSGDY
ncbi:alpha/beta hydrolase [Pseudovibrio exalbescens]|uniref:alpha/beta hydrolase n=1 Tax=Pseudovibrio exalbescens TaxID=197461 RepID=UPI0023658934|nr:alpha/beta hydrolase [Pseudovibrio exalbescens]MDD7909066.1 alpha/beta hydrolase [Pseudovibrio exalbescens]